MPRKAPLPPASSTLVAHRRRHDGWSAARVARFLETLAQTGCVRDAARVAGMSNVAAYRLRAKDAGFAAAWEKALEPAQEGLIAIAYRRAVEGKETIIIRHGEEVERRIAPSDSILSLLVKGLSLEEEARQSFEKRRMAAKVAAKITRMHGRMMAQAAEDGEGCTQCGGPSTEQLRIFCAKPPRAQKSGHATMKPGHGRQQVKGVGMTLMRRMRTGDRKMVPATRFELVTP